MATNTSREGLEKRIAELENIVADQSKTIDGLRKYQDIISSTPDGIALLDTNYRYLVVNNSYEYFSGKSKGELLGKSIAEYLGEEFFIQSAKPRFDRCLQGELQEIIGWVDYPGAGRRFVKVDYFPLRNAQGTISGVIANTRDLTEAQRSEERLRQTLTATNAGIWEWDRTTNTYIWSDEMWRLIGLDPTRWQPSYETWRNSVHPEDRQAVEAEVASAINRGKPFEIEWRVSRPDCTVCWLMSVGTPELDASGEVTAYIGIIIDITIRKQVETKYLESSSLYQDLVETSQDLIWQCDAEGRYIYLNPAWAEIFGYEIDDMLGRKFSDFQTAEDAARDIEEFQHLLAGGSVKGYETIHLGKNRQSIHLVFNAKAVRDKKGKIVGTRGTAYDITERHQIAQQLAKSEENYRNLFAKMLDGFAQHEIICDDSGQPVDYRFLRINPAFEALTGLKAEDLIGRTVLEVLPQTEKYWIETYGRVALTGNAITFENYSQALDKHFMVTAYRPALNQFACIFQDITPRKKAEDRLRDALAFNRMIIKTSPIGMLVFRESGSCILANEYAAKIAQASVDALLKLNYKEMESYKRSGILADMESVLETGQIKNRVVRTINTFGADVWFEGIISCFEIRNEKHILFLFQDIWEKKLMAQQLLKHNAEFQAIFDSITDAIALTDRDRKIMRVNPGFTSLFGYPQSEVEGQTTEMLYASKNDYTLQGAIRYNENTIQDTSIYEVNYRRKDGTIFPGETLGLPVRDEKNRIIGYVGVIRDITQRKTAEEEKALLKQQWQQSQKLEALGTLAGGIAHDFNNLLGVIIGYTELLADDLPKGSHYSHDLSMILEATQRAKDLVQQILAFSRQSQAERFDLNLKPLIKEALKMIRASIPSTIEIIDDCLDDAFVTANPTQIHQVLMNLCTNAFHAMEHRGGELRIALQGESPPPKLKSDNREEKGKATTYIHISVSDTGEGIPPEILTRIFDPFFTTKEKSKGTGMGLSIAYGIVEDHGGVLQVESSPGQGSTFHIYLPQGKGQKTPDPPTQNVPGGKERILFVDDEELLGDVSKAMLERLGYQVITKQSSLEALTTFQNNPSDFDLVITDQTMPGMTGLDLARRMMQIRPDIPIILCTGYSNLVDESLARLHGIKAFTLKPLTKNTIGQLIRQVLGGSKESKKGWEQT